MALRAALRRFGVAPLPVPCGSWRYPSLGQGSGRPAVYGRNAASTSDIPSQSQETWLLLVNQNQLLLNQLLLKDKDKDSVQREKEAVLREMLREKEAVLRDSHRLDMEAAALRVQLADVTSMYLAATNKRNIRGALEYVAAVINTKLGTQQALSSLRQHAGFMAKLDQIARRHNLREADLLRCLDGMYHTFSKDQHGSEDEVFIRETDLTSPVERAALASIFETFNVKYKIVTSGNEVLLDSPYRCHCLPG
jgi:hypothetical protein